ncbi:MAG: glycosyltransferase family 4 protein [Bryobacteraceae bacterium]|nr:glycosyltransferase family 4 protein [Bryobacteraceae bacterium]MDW8378659.1 glycosyltransferase family 1 protein [Bryobacterales bacterium]
MSVYTEKTRMRFAIDAHAIGQHQTGNEVYIRNLLDRLASVDSEADFIAYFSSPAAASRLPNRILRRWVSSNPFVRLGWELGRKINAERPALLHVQYTAPLWSKVPIVVSVHDVSFLEHPEFFSFPRALQLQQTVKRTVERAARVLTVSEFSRAAIERHYPAARGKTCVTPNAVSAAFRPIPRDQARARVQRLLGFSSPFLLNVGDLQPRKNQTGLIRAFEEFLRHNPGQPHHLVIVGQSKFDGELVKQVAARSAVSSRIHFTGYVDDAFLHLLYNACELFVFPSFYEGFGIPILEAMACGCAVACSKTSAMPEVADGAAIFFDPRSTAEMTRSIQDLVLNPEMRSRYQRLGLARASVFSWDRTARQTLEVYYEVAGSDRRFAPDRHSIGAGKS